MIDANNLETMAKARPDEMFLKGTGVLKLLAGIRQLEKELREVRKQDEELIRQLVDALRRSTKYDDSDYAALAAGDARLGGKP